MFKSNYHLKFTYIDLSQNFLCIKVLQIFDILSTIVQLCYLLTNCSCYKYICFTFRAYIPSWLEEEEQNKAANQLTHNINNTLLCEQEDGGAKTKEKRDDYQNKTSTGLITFI